MLMKSPRRTQEKFEVFESVCVYETSKVVCCQGEEDGGVREEEKESK